MRADNEEKKGTVSKVDSMKGVPVKRRLGLSDGKEESMTLGDLNHLELKGWTTFILIQNIINR